jgi:hypothetical protein
MELRYGQREFKFIFIPLTTFSPALKIQAVNVETGAPIKGVYFELWKEDNQVPEEGLTNSNGIYEFIVRSLGMHVV